jgi:hypothetical protein
MTAPVQQHIEQLCLKGGIYTAVCGAGSAVLTSAEFWGVAIAALGTAAAWWGKIRQDRREQAEFNQRMLFDRAEHEERMRMGDLERRKGLS